MPRSTFTRTLLTAFILITLIATPFNDTLAASPTLKDIEQQLKALQAQVDALVQKKPNAQKVTAGEGVEVLCNGIKSVKCYYVATTGSDTNPGTADQPFRTIRKAADVVAAGESVVVREGTYSEVHPVSVAPTSRWSYPALTPNNSGTKTAPITFVAESGKRVLITGPAGPVMGQSGRNYIHWEGFVTDQTAMITNGKGGEFRYNEIIGKYIATGDNHDGIRLNSAPDTYIHHNIIRGVTGDSHNSAGIKLYSKGSPNVIVEDNYIYGNTVGIFDKDYGVNNTYRRNYFTNNSSIDFRGNDQGGYASFEIYDNVFSNGIDLINLNDGSKIHNNFMRGSTLVAVQAGNVKNIQIWNNIVLTSKPTIAAFWERDDVCCDALAYMDYNLYTSVPQYTFHYYGTPPYRSFSEWKALGKGYETNSQIQIPKGDLFVDETSYVLKPAFISAGRYGDKPGPDNIIEILNTARYGPSARSGGVQTTPPPVLSTTPSPIIIPVTPITTSVQTPPPPPTPTPTPTTPNTTTVPTITLTASDRSITHGTSVTLTWSTTNATACTASKGWSGNKNTSGTETVTPGEDTRYVLTCTGTGGSTDTSVKVSVRSPNTTPAPQNTESNTTPSKQTTDRYQTTAILNVRSAPGITAPSIGTQQIGTIGILKESPVTKDGHTWYHLNYDTGADGWSTGLYLKKLTTTDTKTTATNDTKTSKSCLTKAKFTKNTKILITKAKTPVRDTPNGTILKGKKLNAQGTITKDPTCTDTTIWYYVDFKKGTDGYVRETRVKKR